MPGRKKSKPSKRTLALDQAPEEGPDFETAERAALPEDSQEIPVNPPNIPSLVLYTIGHSDLSEDDFFQHMQMHHIGVLVDVRSAPYSRYVPHFNKDRLQAAARARQIAYHFAGEFLGGRPPHPDVYVDGMVPDETTPRLDFLELVQYNEVMKRDWYRRGIYRLLELIRQTSEQGSSVVILCSEGDPGECHRHHLIARSLIDPKVRLPDYPPVQIQHILKDGSLKRVTESDFEVFEQTTLF